MSEPSPEDLAEVVQSTKNLEARLREFISKEDIAGITRFAFEYAAQEAEHTKLPREHFHILASVRRYTFLDAAYRKLFELNKDDESIVSMEYQSPPLEMIQEFLRQQYQKRLK